jgi:hydroxyethylthiazole kinase
MDLHWSKLMNAVRAVRTQSPLVHNITNYVVMNNTANALLAIGASPVMVHAEEEVADIAAISGALVVNIGTLSPYWVKGMHKALQTARQLGKPTVIDPVGAGASPYRTQQVIELIRENTPTVIRGNASEIKALVATGVVTKGVDSTDAPEAALEAGQWLSKEMGCIVVISGATDLVIKGDQVRKVLFGSPLMTKVTGLGCSASALMGAFLAAVPDALEAATATMQVMGMAGEMAAQRAEGPGTLQLHFLDALYNFETWAAQSYTHLASQSAS